jgi:hypothetical protein
MLVAVSVVENVAVAVTAAVLIIVPTVAWLLDRRSSGEGLAVEVGWRFTFDRGPDPIYIVAITLRNLKRRPVEVAAWALVLPDGRTVASPLLVDAKTSGVPAVVAPGTEETWYAPADALEAILGLAGYPRDVAIKGCVSLADGGEVWSGTSITLLELRSPRRHGHLPPIPARIVTVRPRRRPRLAHVPQRV